MAEARYPADIMAAAVVPWTADWQLDERLFRRELALLAASYRHIYIFGTAGEGYAVDDRQFLQVVRVYVEELRGGGVEPMVGVISLSLPTIIARIEAACELGVRRFQLSLPSWGALGEGEVFTFFEQVLGRFPDCQFLHYNLLRTKRLVTPGEYGRLAAAHPNLVATKNSTDAMARIAGLLTEAPQIRHFLWKLHDPEFPLRLLPPYRAAAADAADRLAAFLREHFPHWAPSPLADAASAPASDERSHR